MKTANRIAEMLGRGDYPDAALGTMSGPKLV